jgi:hypothetical protein
MCPSDGLSTLPGTFEKHAGINPQTRVLAEQHRLRTPECPSLLRLAEALQRSDWTLEEQKHTRDCAYCQMVMAMEEAS